MFAKTGRDDGESSPLTDRSDDLTEVGSVELESMADEVEAWRVWELSRT